MIQSLRVLVAISVIAFASVGCQKGAKSGAQGNHEENGGGAAATSTEGTTSSGGAASTEAAKSGSESHAGAKSSSGEAAKGTRLTLTQPDDGTVLDLKVGQVVTVSLDSNHAEGMLWTLAKSTETVIVPEGAPVYATSKTGGTETWRFRAARPGQQSVRLEYGRKWQENTPERTFHFDATVR